MSDALTPILAAKRAHVARMKQFRPRAELEAAIASLPAARSFSGALRDAAAQDRYALIAEMKRKSPSGGEIRPGFDPSIIARDYASGGATCLSILTDEPYFGGRDDDLTRAHAAVSLPMLRKDFIVDAYQIVESRALKADCILLIVAALRDDELQSFAREAARFGMNVLAEAHDEEELDRALRIDNALIGINNRDLKKLKTDLATFERLAPRVPGDRLLVAESGLHSTADLKRMKNAGAHAYLVGESLLRQGDLISATRKLLGP